MITPAYGPHWKSSIAKMSPFLWHLHAIHDPRFRRAPQVAYWNRKRMPKKTRKAKR
jgi:hypothetical protein